ncbi:YgaP family membrane protein [Halococcus thailandensis]|uniref:YgaP family membrane protein n=1 Tax=Halococcus thailandensis TaxID=335952 RepID=UPI00373AF3A3
MTVPPSTLSDDVRNTSTSADEGDPDNKHGNSNMNNNDTSEEPKSRPATADTDDDIEELRRAVEDKYDFENFDAQNMAQMDAEEGDAVFDPDSWITGDRLLDRVEADLKNRIADRDVFARIKRFSGGDRLLDRVEADLKNRIADRDVFARIKRFSGDDETNRLVAYSDEGYVTVYPDGSVEGQGTVLRDVKPTVALCSMDDYEITPPPDGEPLPDPSEVPESSGELGNLMLQIIAFALLIGGVVLVGAAVFGDLGRAAIIAGVVGLGFVITALLFFILVANARLSDRFRAEEYRDRLRSVGLGSGEQPDFDPSKLDRQIKNQDE